MMRKLNESEKTLAVSMYQHGIKLAAIAKGLGIGKTTIYGFLKAAGCPVHNEAQSLASQRGAAVRRLRKAAQEQPQPSEQPSEASLQPQPMEHGGKVLRIAYSDKKDLLWQLEQIKISLMKEV